MNPWISIEEGMPEPCQLVQVWTDYERHPFWQECFGPPVTPSFRFSTGWVDEKEGWHLHVVGDLRVHNYRAVERPGEGGLAGPVKVLFWMPLPEPPPGQSWPKLKIALCVAPPAATAGGAT
jgi:hypothetical protein